jgi:hypothetical protein
MKSGKVCVIPPKKVYFICTEGETEKQYFDQFKGGNFTIKCFSCKGKTKDVLQTIEKRCLAGKADFCWLVLDVDDHKSGYFDSLFEWKKGKITRGLAISNPCFEYWILLHYQKPTKTCNKPGDCIEQLNDHVAYSKDISGIKFDREAIDRAINFADQIESENKDRPITERNGSTVFQLVKDLIKVPHVPF